MCMVVIYVVQALPDGDTSVFAFWQFLGVWGRRQLMPQLAKWIWKYNSRKSLMPIHIYICIYPIHITYYLWNTTARRTLFSSPRPGATTCNIGEESGPPPPTKHIYMRMVNFTPFACCTSIAIVAPLYMMWFWLQNWTHIASSNHRSCGICIYFLNDPWLCIRRLWRCQ